MKVEQYIENVILLIGWYKIQIIYILVVKHDIPIYDNIIK